VHEPGYGWEHGGLGAFAKRAAVSPGLDVTYQFFSTFNGRIALH